MRLRQFIPELDGALLCDWANRDERIHALWSAYRFPYPLTENSLLQVLEQFHTEFAQEAFIALNDQEEPVGFACYNVLNPETGFLKFIMLSPDYRGQGYGSRMLKLVLRYAEEISGVQTVGINVFHVNEPAIRCYERLGFVKTTETENALTYHEESWNRIGMSYTCRKRSGGKLLQELKNYQPYNEQEEKDLAFIAKFLTENSDAFLRSNVTAHMTASAWVINQDASKVLMVYHNIYHSWSWLGGHADGEEDLLSVAIREVQEEAGIQNVTPVSTDIYSVEVLTVDGHEKKGAYVSSHLHLNVTYLLQADSEETVHMKEDENSGVGWFTPEEALQKSTEPWFVERIYKKLIEKRKSHV